MEWSKVTKKKTQQRHSLNLEIVLHPFPFTCRRLIQQVKRNRGSVSKQHMSRHKNP
jgi:hypothetical protein